jgi:hypothetical protein
MATFSKFVTGIPLTPPAPPIARRGSTSNVTKDPLTRRQSLFAGFKPSLITRHTQPPEITLTGSPPSDNDGQTELGQSSVPTRRQSLRRALSATISIPRPSSILRRSPSPISPSTSFLSNEPLEEHPRSESPQGEVESPRTGVESPATADEASFPTPNFASVKKPSSSSDVAGPRFQRQATPLEQDPSVERFAGEPDIYSDILVSLIRISYNTFSN